MVKSQFKQLMLVVALCIPSLLYSQDKQDAKKDPQSTYEPRSQPGEGQKFLEKFQGDWDVEKVFYPRSGDPVTSGGQCSQTMINGGRFLRSEFTFGDGESKTTGQGFIGFEPESGMFTSVWIDSRSTRMSFRQSKERFDGKEIVLYAKTLQDTGKAMRISRTNTHMEEDGHKLIHRQYSITSDGAERLVMELLMTRRSSHSLAK